MSASHLSRKTITSDVTGAPNDINQDLTYLRAEVNIEVSGAACDGELTDKLHDELADAVRTAIEEFDAGDSDE